MSTTVGPPPLDVLPVPEPKPRRWTREEYLRLAAQGIFLPDERVELIGGEIYRMPPQKNRHAAAVTRAAEACRHCFPSGYWVRVQMTLALGDSMPDPDIAVIEGEIEDHSEEYPTTALLVIEASDATLAFDCRQKASLYASAGVPDYWILNLVDGLVEVRRDTVPAPAAPHGWDYATVIIARPGEQIASLAAPDATIDVSELLRWRLGP